MRGERCGEGGRKRGERTLSAAALRTFLPIRSTDERLLMLGFLCTI